MEQPAHNAIYCAIRTTFYAFALSCLCGCASKQTYSGRVVDAETGQPIVGAEISATYYERGKFAPSLDGCFLRIPVQASAVTDANGEFSLQVGRHHLDFWVSGPADSRAYRHSVRWWRVDEHHPDTLCIPLGKTGE
jgi:hypothetical protein